MSSGRDQRRSRTEALENGLPPSTPIDSETPLLRAVNLHAEYFSASENISALDGVTFSVYRNRILGVVGESGCGKSTLAYAVMGLIDGVSGKVHAESLSLAGEDLHSMSRRQLTRIRGSRMGMVFQNPASHLNPVYTVENHICEAIRVHEACSMRAARKRALALLERVGIPDAERHLRSYAHQLSGGMQQRVMIAIALACSPELLIADEPTTALDVTIQAQIIELILELKNDFNMGVMLITHDMGVIAEMADQVAVMYAGSIVEFGETRRLFAAPRHPYTQGLLSSIPSTEHNVPRLPSIPGTVPDLKSDMVGCKFADRCPLVMSICRDKTPSLFAVNDRSNDSVHQNACWNDPEAPDA